MFEKISVKQKWRNEMFKYRGIRRVFFKYPDESLELLIFENFLREYSKKAGKSRSYVLMYNLDYDDYEKKYRTAAINAFNTLLDSHWISIYNNEKCQFDIEYRTKDFSMIITLK